MLMKQVPLSMMITSPQFLVFQYVIFHCILLLVYSEVDVFLYVFLSIILILTKFEAFKSYFIYSSKGFSKVAAISLMVFHLMLLPSRPVFQLHSLSSTRGLKSKKISFDTSITVYGFPVTFLQLINVNHCVGT